jgi:hypothetical protein
MKKFFAILAEHFQRLAGNSTGNEAGAAPLFPPSAGTNLPAVPTALPSASMRGTTPTASRSNQGRNEGSASGGASSLRNKGTPSLNPDFITRQELNRELDLLRRLIESRK